MSEILGFFVPFGAASPDWAKLKGQGSFVYIAGGRGASTEPGLADKWQAAGAAGLARGLLFAYQPRASMDWKNQVALFASLVNQFPGELPPTLELLDSGPFKKNDLSLNSAKFAQNFEEQTGKDLVLRSNAAFFDTAYPIEDWPKRKPLWISSSPTSSPAVPLVWSKQTPAWVLFSNAPDRIKFFSDEKDFRKRLGWTIGDPVAAGGATPGGGAAPGGGASAGGLTFKVTTDKLTVRSAPGVTGAPQGEILNGAEITIEDVSAPAEAWVKIKGGGWVALAFQGKKMLEKK